jgi:hypothetical protein
MSAHRSRLVLPFVFALAAVVPTPSAAQMSPADSAAVLLSTAAAFEAEGRVEVAEALFEFIAEHFGSTPAGLEAQRRLGASGEEGLERSGSTELRIWATTYGLWLGVAVPAAFGADGTEPYGVGLLLGGPAGLFAGRAFTRSRPISVGQARAITWGGTWGTWQGLGWAHVLDLGEDQRCDEFGYCYESGNPDEERFAAMVVGGLAGVIAGSIIARNPVPSAVATGANLGSLWGTWFGAASTVLFDIDDDAAMLTTLLAGNVGLGVGALAASRLNMSRSRVRMVSIGGVVGAVGGLGLDLIIQPDDEKAAIAIPMAGSILGLAIAMGTTQDRQVVPGAGEDFGNALFNLNDGELSLGMPLPTPTLVPWEGRGRPEWRPAASLELFRASFR